MFIADCINPYHGDNDRPSCCESTVDRQARPRDETSLRTGEISDHLCNFIDVGTELSALVIKARTPASLTDAAVFSASSGLLI